MDTYLNERINIVNTKHIKVHRTRTLMKIHIQKFENVFIDDIILIISNDQSVKIITSFC